MFILYSPDFTRHLIMTFLFPLVLLAGENSVNYRNLWKSIQQQQLIKTNLKQKFSKTPEESLP